MSSFGHSYTVKLAAYKDYDGLKQMIAQLPDKEDKEEIIVHERNGLHYAFSKTFESKHEARSALLRYKKVFSDAYIIQEKRVQTPSITVKKKAVNNGALENDLPQSDVSQNDVLEKYLLKEVNAKETTYKFMNFNNVFSKRGKVSSPEKLSLIWSDQLKLHNNIFYVKYMEGSKVEKQKLMKFFFNKGTVIFANILDKKPIISRLFYNIKNRDMTVYSQNKKISVKKYIEKVNDTYLLVKMYMYGKRINEAKYYFNRSDALMDKN